MKKRYVEVAPKSRKEKHMCFTSQLHREGIGGINFLNDSPVTAKGSNYSSFHHMTHCHLMADFAYLAQ